MPFYAIRCKNAAGGNGLGERMEIAATFFLGAWIGPAVVGSRDRKSARPIASLFGVKEHCDLPRFANL
jgi:hypothetical protein